jgi:hypothetical protein
MTSTDTTAAAEATPATAKQKIIAAMWRLGQPATAKDIATNAGIGYSTATPLLRTLLGTDQAIKTTADNGTTLWRLTLDGGADEPTATSSNDPADTVESDAAPSIGAEADSGVTSDQRKAHPDEPHHDTAADDATANAVEDITDDTGEDAADNAVEDTVEDAPDVGSDEDSTAPAGVSVGDVTADDISSSEEPDGEQSSARSYSKPQHPRRAKGALREAVLAVLRSEPDRAFKVMEICKIIDAANTDQSANKAGPGAVVNACDKLVGSGDATRRDGKPATFQANAAA